MMQLTAISKLKRFCLTAALIIPLFLTGLPLYAYADASFEDREQERIDETVAFTNSLYEGNAKNDELFLRDTREFDYHAANIQEVLASILPGKLTDTEKTEAIYKYITQNISYNDDNSIYGQDASHVLENKYGVCEGFSSLLTAMLRGSGIPSMKLAGDVNDPMNHAWVCAYVDGVWRYYDATWDEKNKKLHDSWSYYALTPEQIAKDHELWAIADDASGISENYNVTFDRPELTMQTGETISIKATINTPTWRNYLAEKRTRGKWYLAFGMQDEEHPGEDGNGCINVHISDMTETSAVCTIQALKPGKYSFMLTQTGSLGYAKATITIDGEAQKGMVTNEFTARPVLDSSEAAWTSDEDSVHGTLFLGQCAYLKVEASCKEGSIDTFWWDNITGKQMNTEGSVREIRTDPMPKNGRLSYSCRVTDRYGNEKIIKWEIDYADPLDNMAQLSLLADGNAVDVTKALSVPTGKSVKLTAVLTKGSAENITYQWYRLDKMSFPPVFSGHEISGATSESYVLTDVKSGECYACAATLSNGTAYAWISVTTSNESSNKTNDENAVSQRAVFRMYNPNSGEHFYTVSATEAQGLVSAGWKKESEKAWVAPESSNQPVYRLYNPNHGGEHHYTLDPAEKSALVHSGWQDEGVAFYSDESKGTPIYCQYNKNAIARNHNYTSDSAEKTSLVQVGWRDEGVCWYGM